MPLDEPILPEPLIAAHDEAQVLRQRLRLESAIARIAAALTTPGELDLDGVLAELGGAVQVHRTYIMRFREHGSVVDNTHEWCAAGVAPEMPNLQGVDATPLRWWLGLMQAGEPVVIPDVAQLPPDADAERTLLTAQGIRSLLAMPLISRDRGLLGFVGHDDVAGPRRWSAEHQRALRVVCDLLAAELDRRHAAEILRASEERQQLVLDATTDGFWDWDITTDTVVFSDRWFEILHEPAPTAPTGSLYWFERLHPYDREAARTSLLDHLRGATPQWLTEQRVRDGRGEWRWILTRGRVVARDAAGQATRAVGTHTDVSARRGLEEQLRQAQKMEAVGRLAGGIAHDFNNLLTVITGHALLLADQLALHEAARPHALEIRAAADRAADLTRQLLAFSRKQRLRPQVLDLCAVVHELQRLLVRLIGEQVELVTDGAPGTAFVRADPGQMQQVLMNLAVNARDAMPRGGRLRLQVHASHLAHALTTSHDIVPAGEWVVLTVTDTGEGIPRELLPRIFEPFFTTKAQGEGTGLGLATVFGIVRQSGGHIRVESECGVGTTVGIYLPRVAAPAAPTMPAVSVPVASGLTSGAGRILLVEDDPIVLRTVASVLEASGYSTVQASCPLEALRLADGLEPVDLILADVVMPRMSGTELVSRLRRRWPQTRVLMMSGYPMRETVEAFGVDTTHAFIRKPFTPTALSARLAEVLRR
jgi:two-component system cell cycle sensor histidine kinase/response regulator CckA